MTSETTKNFIVDNKHILIPLGLTISMLAAAFWIGTTLAVINTKLDKFDAYMVQANADIKTIYQELNAVEHRLTVLEVMHQK